MEQQEVSVEYDTPRRDNYNTILAQAELEEAGLQGQNIFQQFEDQNAASVQKYNIKAIGGENNLHKKQNRSAKPALVPPCKMICVRNSVLENEMFPLIADENIDPEDLNKKINYGITDNFSKMDAKMVKVVQSKMKLEAMKKRQQQYQQGIQNQMDSKQAKQQKQRNSFIEHRIKNCQQRSKQWQDRKQNHENFILEKEILKQIMQDEYNITQQQFWQKKENPNRLSTQFDQLDQNYNKSIQFIQRNNQSLSIQTGKPQKDSQRPDTANTILSIIHNNSRQNARINYGNTNNINNQNNFEQERNENMKNIQLTGDKIGQTRSQTAGTSTQQNNRKKMLSQSFYNPQLGNKQLNTSYSIKRDSSLQNQSNLPHNKQNIRNNNLVQELYSNNNNQQNSSTSDFNRQSLNKSDLDIQQQSFILNNVLSVQNQSNSNHLLSEINIQRDFYISNPYTRSVIKESLTQPLSKKNLLLDQTSLVSDYMNKQQQQQQQHTPSSSISQIKPRFSNHSKILHQGYNNNIMITPNNKNVSSTKFQSISPAHSSKILFKKQDQKLSYDKRRYQCLNKIYQNKVNQLNQDEVFTDKMRKQKLQDLVRRKISVNFPGNYKLKINFSLVEKLDKEDDNQNQISHSQEQYNNIQQQQQQQQQSPLQQNYFNHSNLIKNGWNTASHQINRTPQSKNNNLKQKLESQSYSIPNNYNNDPSSDEDGEQVIKYIKNL